MRPIILGNISTGMGNPSPVLLNNTGKLRDDFYEAAVLEYFQEWEGCDFQVSEQRVSVGVEPSYQFDELRIITICVDIGKSTFHTGKSWRSYGSAIAQRTKYYSDYKYSCKFTRFVNSWHPVLFP